MKKTIKRIFQITFADDKNTATQQVFNYAFDNVIDKNKRSYILGLGSTLASLGACTAPIDPDAKKVTPATNPLVFTQSENVSVELCGDVICLDDTSLDSTGLDGTGISINSPDGLPGAPPIVNTISDSTPASNSVFSDGVLPAQTFTSIGPGLASVDASDMQSQTDLQLMSDGTAIKVWGFKNKAGTAFNNDLNRLCPGPVIEAIEGQPMTIALSSKYPHTLHLHGLDVDQVNDGSPTTSGFVSQLDPSAPGTSPAPNIKNPPGVWLGSSFEYKFIAPHAGTYMYNCHVDTVLHMEMGMVGTIIVRPADGSNNTLWTNGPIFDREYIWQLHTFDSRWHLAPSGTGANTMRYSPDYFMINGRDGVDILSDPTSAVEAYAGQQVVIRLVNIGYQPAVVSLGGIPFDVVASDGRPLKKLYIELVTTILLAPGERYDIMFTMPATGIGNASVEYLDIRGRNILGSANSTITSL